MSDLVVVTRDRDVGVITINLYCCRPRPEWPWRERLRELLGATHVEVQEVCRAGAPAWL